MNKGNYYKRKTKDWLVKEGYVCEYLEKLQRLFVKGKLIYIKRDLFASDILAMKEDKLIFVQVKSGGEKTGINIKNAIKEFDKYPFPDFVDRWVIIWRERQREPEIIDVNDIKC